MKRTRIIGVLLALIIVLNTVPLAQAAGDSYATRGEIVQMLMSAADDYHPNLQKSDIIKGYSDGALNENQYATRAEAFVMVSRAFGKLDAPTGHNARVAVTDLVYDDVPAWAKADVQNLVRGGVLVGTGHGKLSPNNYITTGQMELIIKRVFMLKGTNIKDDFFSAFNREILANTELRPGYSIDGTIMQMVDNTNESIRAIMNDIIEGSNAKDSVEQKISNYYHNIIDLDARNKACVAPIKEYLDLARAAKSLDDILRLRGKLLKETGLMTLIGFSPAVDLKDSGVYSMIFSSAAPILPKATYAQNDPSQMAAYKTYISKLFTHSGMKETDAQSAAETVVLCEAQIAADMLDPQDYANAEKLYNTFTMDELQKLFPKINLRELLIEDGYKEIEKATVYDVGALKATARFFTEEHLAELKVFIQYQILISLSDLLCKDFMEIGQEFNQAFMGIEAQTDINEIALSIVQNTMSDYLGKIYAENYFSPKAKADVESMVQDFIRIYSDRIKNLSWMSERTKEMAQRKLDSMAVKVGYPNQWKSFPNNIDIKSAAEGGSYYENTIAIARYHFQENQKLQGGKVDKSLWNIPVYTVDAYYSPLANEIIFPAGILQAPFYDIEASREENLGGIGFIIAHEITHSFDNNGAQFDENGNAANWWEEEDFNQFNLLCLRVANFYDGVESAPGIVNDGWLTLSENIADLGAMYCITQAVSQLESPDYKKMFESLAYCWAASTTREVLSYLSIADVHSWRSIRVNQNVQCMNIFYDIYDVKPGDGMYVAPQDRVIVW